MVGERLICKVTGLENCQPVNNVNISTVYIMFIIILHNNIAKTDRLCDV